MTAIVMAGRTGGAYAARIATMRGNEELDALEVVGIPVTDYLILPSVLALVFTMPLLYLYGCLIGIFGGLLVSIGMLNITTLGFVHQTLDAIPFSQFVFGFVKSIAFAVMIGVTSCRIGLQAGGVPPTWAWRQPGPSSPASSASSQWMLCSRWQPMSSGYDDGQARLAPQGVAPLMSLRDVTLAFGPRVIQRNLSFDVRRGSIFAVMGGSGCGKSTVLKSMIGLLRPRVGQFLVEGEDYWAGSEARRSEIGRRRFGVLSKMRLSGAR